VPNTAAIAIATASQYNDFDHVKIGAGFERLT
jgi:hypothetical protein